MTPEKTLRLTSPAALLWPDLAGARGREENGTRQHTGRPARRVGGREMRVVQG